MLSRSNAAARSTHPERGNEALHWGANKQLLAIVLLYYFVSCLPSRGPLLPLSYNLAAVSDYVSMLVVSLVVYVWDSGGVIHEAVKHLQAAAPERYHACFGGV